MFTVFRSSRSRPVQDLRERPSSMHFIDGAEYFCNEQMCPPRIGNVIPYADDRHITAAYSRTLTPMLSRKPSGLHSPSWM